MHEQALSRYMDRSIPFYSDRYGDDRKSVTENDNHKCNRLFHFCSKDVCFLSALSPCVKETRTYSRFTVKS